MRTPKLFSLPYICVDCGEIFPVPEVFTVRKRRAICPKCNSIKTRMAHVDEYIE